MNKIKSEPNSVNLNNIKNEDKLKYSNNKILKINTNINITNNKSIANNSNSIEDNKENKENKLHTNKQNNINFKNSNNNSNNININNFLTELEAPIKKLNISSSSKTLRYSNLGESEISVGKLSDISKDYKEITNEISKIVTGNVNGDLSNITNITNSKNNSAIGAVPLNDDTWTIKKENIDTSENFELRVREMKKKNEIKAIKNIQKNKNENLYCYNYNSNFNNTNNLKMITNPSKINNSIIDKFLINKKQKDECNLEDTNEYVPKANLNHLSAEKQNIPKFLNLNSPTGLFNLENNMNSSYYLKMLDNENIKLSNDNFCVKKTDNNNKITINARENNHKNEVLGHTPGFVNDQSINSNNNIVNNDIYNNNNYHSKFNINCNEYNNNKNKNLWINYPARKLQFSMTSHSNSDINNDALDNSDNSSTKNNLNYSKKNSNNYIENYYFSGNLSNNEALPSRSYIRPINTENSPYIVKKEKIIKRSNDNSSNNSCNNIHTENNLNQDNSKNLTDKEDKKEKTNDNQNDLNSKIYSNTMNYNPKSYFNVNDAKKFSFANNLNYYTPTDNLINSSQIFSNVNVLNAPSYVPNSVKNSLNFSNKQMNNNFDNSKNNYIMNTNQDIKNNTLFNNINNADIDYVTNKNINFNMQNKYNFNAYNNLNPQLSNILNNNANLKYQYNQIYQNNNGIKLDVKEKKKAKDEVNLNNNFLINLEEVSIFL